MTSSTSALTPSTTLAKSSPIAWKERLAFFVARFGNNPVWSTINSFLLIFYTDVVGLDPAAVGTLFVVARLLDGLSDPVMGYLVDHLPPTRWGRFRPYLAVGSILCALNYALLWLGPALAPMGQLAIAYVTYLLLGFTYDLMDIPLNALLPAMTPDPQERNTLSMLNGLGQMVSALLIGVVTVPIVAQFSTPREGWISVIIVLAVLVPTLSFLGALGVRERVTPSTDTQYGFLDLLRMLVSTRPLLLFAIPFLLVGIGFGTLSAASIFYFTYYVGDAALFGLASGVMLPAVIVGIIVFPSLGRRFEKKPLMVTAYLLMGVSAGVRFLFPATATAAILTTYFFTGLGMGGGIALSGSIAADLVDYVEWRHGYRAEGAVTALQTLIGKASAGLGGAVPSFVLAASGYTPNGNQSPEALAGILLTVSLLPFVLCLLAGIGFVAYPLNRAAIWSIHRDLQSRRPTAD